MSGWLRQLLLGAEWGAVMGKGNEGRAPWTHPPCLSAVEITQVGVRVPAWAACTLIDVHVLEVDVHLHLPPREANWQLGAQWGC